MHIVLDSSTVYGVAVMAQWTPERVPRVAALAPPPTFAVAEKPETTGCIVCDRQESGAVVNCCKNYVDNGVRKAALVALGR
jgi:hypothetical protein